MNRGLISMRYAKALFQLGRDQEGLLDRLYEDCNSLNKMLKDSKELVLFLQSPVIKASIKKRFIRDNFKSLLHESFLKFLELVIDNNREPLSRDIMLNFMDLYRDYMGVKSVTIITAVPVEESFRNEICSIIEERLKGQVELDCRVDKDILGGLVVMIDGKQADGSIAGKLRAMKKKML